MEIKHKTKARLVIAKDNSEAIWTIIGIFLFVFITHSWIDLSGKSYFIVFLALILWGVAAISFGNFLAYLLQSKITLTIDKKLKTVEKKEHYPFLHRRELSSFKFDEIKKVSLISDYAGGSRLYHSLTCSLYLVVASDTDLNVHSSMSLPIYARRQKKRYKAFENEMRECAEQVADMLDMPLNFVSHVLWDSKDFLFKEIK